VHLEALRVLGPGVRRLVGRDGKEQLLGGFDAVLDCVGSGASIETACSAVRPGGRVVLVGMPGVVKADLALLWLREVQLHGAYGYREDFPAAIALAHRRGLGRLVGGGWHLRDYRRALAEGPRASRSGKVKTVFDLRSPA
jgi:threonine dehydrogenase-like Zn-dependent dehydrogenase